MSGLSLPKLSCLGHLKTFYKLVILKTKDLKTTNSDCKKATKQSSRYCSVESVECVIHMTGGIVKLAFNYKSLF